MPNGHPVSDTSSTASVTKSIVSALAGIALEEKYINSTDQKLKDFFPEIDFDGMGISGDHQIWFAWGHGGQMVVIIRDLNIVVVATASVPPGFDDYAWQKTKAVMELVGRFIGQI